MLIEKEETWAGGGNAGPCVEVLIGGLEVATLVFMNLAQKAGGDIMIKGEPYVRILSQNAMLSGLMDITGEANLMQLRNCRPQQVFSLHVR